MPSVCEFRQELIYHYYSELIASFDMNELNISWPAKKKNGSRAHPVNALAAADEETYACNMQYGVSQTRKQSDVWQADKNSARIQHYFMHMNYG